MANSFYLLSTIFNNPFKNNCILLMLLLSLSQLQYINGAVCSVNSKIKQGDTCFNRIITIKGRAGQFTLRKDGILLIEFSDEGKRLFYGLKANEEDFFQTKIHYLK